MNCKALVTMGQETQLHFKMLEADSQVTKQLGSGDIRRDVPPGKVVHIVIGVGLSWSVFRVPLCMLNLFF